MTVQDLKSANVLLTNDGRAKIADVVRLPALPSHSYLFLIFFVCMLLGEGSCISCNCKSLFKYLFCTCEQQYTLCVHARVRVGGRGGGRDGGREGGWVEGREGERLTVGL